MRSFKHWTPRYVRDRLADIWFLRTHPGLPWLTPHAVEFLGQWLVPTDVGFEWGSGRSTIWFSNRVAKLTSVEHEREWYARTAPELKQSVRYLLYEDGSGTAADCSYVNAIHEVANGSLDFVLVDGMLRDHCTVVAIPKVKPGGILVIDNANWYFARSNPSHSPDSRSLEMGHASSVWAAVYETLKPWRCIWTTNGVTDTAIWIKPPHVV